MDFMILSSLQVYDSPIVFFPMRILRFRAIKSLAQGVDLGRGGIQMREA